jgi:hypothetical protein
MLFRKTLFTMLKWLDKKGKFSKHKFLTVEKFRTKRRRFRIKHLVLSIIFTIWVITEDLMNE